MEIEIVRVINQFGQNTFIDNVTNFVCWIPFIIILWTTLGIITVIIDKEKGKWVFLGIIIALILHFVISEGIFKHFLANVFDIFRTRPWVEFNDITPIGKQFTDSSFPSSHMASTLAVLTVFVYFYRKTWPYALIFTLFMAFSRIHNGMHYPTDVLAGSVLGIIYGTSAIYIVKNIVKKKLRIF